MSVVTRSHSLSFFAHFVVACGVVWKRQGPSYWRADRRLCLWLFLSWWWCTWVSWYARCRWPSADRNPIVFHIFVPMFGVFVIYATSPVWTDHHHCHSLRRYCFKLPGSACGSLFSTCLANSESTKPPLFYHNESKSLSSVSPHPSWRLHQTHKHQTSQKGTYTMRKTTYWARSL